ncbi:hypothetical protein DFS34DRAFT_360434 [Phlyctochytrium arcticum]|nr:hypothetical protein DFS34DRAFT_360434 [Phlyctochytrium arcticum]
MNLIYAAIVSAILAYLWIAHPADQDSKKGQSSNKKDGVEFLPGAPNPNVSSGGAKKRKTKKNKKGSKDKGDTDDVDDQEGKPTTDGAKEEGVTSRKAKAGRKRGDADSLGAGVSTSVVEEPKLVKNTGKLTNTSTGKQKGKSKPEVRTDNKSETPTVIVTEEPESTSVAPEQESKASNDGESRSDKRKIVPSESVTAVAPDMGTDDGPDYMSRVLRLRGQDELSATELEEEEGWQMVDVRAKNKQPKSRTPAPVSAATAAPLAVIAAEDPSKLTKKQRENLRKAERIKAAKNSSVDGQEVRLQQYRKEQERNWVKNQAQQEQAAMRARALQGTSVSVPTAPASSASAAPASSSGGEWDGKGIWD